MTAPLGEPAHKIRVEQVGIGGIRWRASCKCGWDSLKTITRLEAVARGTLHELNPNEEEM